MKIIDKIKRKWMKLRLQPVRVYCLHHVCAKFDAESMNACDWMQIDEFKTNVIAMQQKGVEFISLKDAYRHICNDRIRCKKYAVLTFDDGYASLKEILPWLEEQNVPATLFINGKYLDGKSYRKNPKERYLTKDDIGTLLSPLIEIGNHGLEHICMTDMTEAEFEETAARNVCLLQKLPNYISFWAYTWGKHTDVADRYLLSQEIIPVYMDGMSNYNKSDVIHRELL